MQNMKRWLIKFGEKEHLEQIINGSLRFCTLGYYSEYEENENEKGTKDYAEGATEIINLKTTTSSLTLCGFTEEELGNISKESIIILVPKKEKYISCFSYFTEEDIVKKEIISKSVLENKNWNHILLFKDPNTFISNLNTVIGNRCSAKFVQYYKKDQDTDNLNEFSKSEQFSYQKEFRISFLKSQEHNVNIEQSGDKTCFVHFGKTDGFICSTKEFQEKIHFYINECQPLS